MVNIKNRKQIIPKLLFFNSFPPHFNKKIITVQYLHSYTLRDAPNSLNGPLLSNYKKIRGRQITSSAPLYLSWLQVIIMRLPARINY